MFIPEGHIPCLIYIRALKMRQKFPAELQTHFTSKQTDNAMVLWKGVLLSIR